MPRLNAFQLKWIAIIGMICNHVVFGLREIIPLWLQFPLYAAGGLTFPIMGYFLVEGYKHTSNLKRYIFRICIFGLIAVPFHYITFRVFAVNIMFSLALGLLLLVMYDRIKIRPLFWLIFVFFIFGSFLSDLPIITFLLIILYYTIKNETVRRLVPPIIGGVILFLLSILMIGYANLLKGFPETLEMAELLIDKLGGVEFMWVGTSFILGCIVAGFLLKNYNGERGKTMKWAFYIIYPVHLAVICGLYLVIMGS
ncbi:MAG: conjugal transfer protein TraX [Defluviitaleaceae bacterium]|nr:conjugal transfer protein TraX [Defluviitaleaceae bacterium]